MRHENYLEATVRFERLAHVGAVDVIAAILFGKYQKRSIDVVSSHVLRDFMRSVNIVGDLGAVSHFLSLFCAIIVPEQVRTGNPTISG